MWLDRLTAGGTTPSASRESLIPSRSYSPSPRKNSLLGSSQQRTLSGLGVSGPKSNTPLDLSANTSTTSLASAPRHANGSALRFEQKPPPDVADPVNVLKAILGKPLNVKREAEESQNRSKRHIVDIEFKGMSLQQFADQDTPTHASTIGHTIELSAKENREKYKDFHSSVLECDQVLKNVETYLTNFKAELGQVSAEIEELQARSIQLNARLDNRRNVEKLLGPAVEEVSLSPLTVRSIAEGPIDEAFVRALNEVEARSLIIEAKEKKSEQVKALQDLKPLLEDLKTKAMERIRDYIVAQIKALRSPNINAQVIQQQTLLRHKDLYAFLARHNSVLAEEIGQAYVNTMRWYYSSHFSRYQQALSSLQIHAFDQHDLLGSDPAPARRNVLGASKPVPPQHEAFSLGRREEIIKTKSEAPAIPAYLAEDSKSPHYLEVPFRNFNQALIDNVSAEYSVITELFATSTYHQISRRVAEIFEPTFSMGHTLTKSLIENTNDCLGVLLCVRLNQYFAFELQRRKVPVADSYVNYTNILLWPRFQVVMDAHCESLKKVPAPNGGNRSAAAAFSLVGGGASDPSRASVAPHAITQRFGQFLQGLLLLSADTGDDEPVSHSLARLRTEYESLMGKLAKGAGDAGKRARFLYNNYSLVLTIVSDTKGKLAEEQKEHFGGLVKELNGK